MTPEQFCYWLQGFAEMGQPAVPTAKEWSIIKDHLQLVFRKKTPAYPLPGFTTPTPNRLDSYPPGYLDRFKDMVYPKITC